jgi:hypothetical protein
MAVASVPEADFDAWTRLECDQSGGLAVEFQRTSADLFDTTRSTAGRSRAGAFAHGKRAGIQSHFKVLVEIGNCARFLMWLGGMRMALSSKTKLGITIAVAVIAGLASVLLSVLLLVLAVFFIAWGQVPERTETFVKGLPYGSSVLNALAKLDSTLTDRS